MPGRSYNSNSYTYGYGSHEKIDEVQGSGNIVDMGDRWLDTRLGRTPKPDSKGYLYPGVSPYSYANDNPILFIDPDGKEVVAVNKEARQNILNSLSPEDRKYVKFNKDGRLNVRRLSKAE